MKYSSVFALFIASTQACGLHEIIALENAIANGDVRQLAGSGYDYKNPSEWPELFPVECAGAAQSPIVLPKQGVFERNIPKAQQKCFKSIEPNYYLGGKTGLKITNGGFSISVNMHDVPKESYVKAPNFSSLVGRSDEEGCGKKNKWVLDQFHFHWGKDSEHGSEHRVGNKATALEVHFVHHNAKYASLGDAIPHKDGLLVVGRMFDEHKKHGNNQVDTIVEAIKKQYGDASSFHKGDAASLPRSFNPERLLFATKDKSEFNGYYSYGGGLTTPGCNEVVSWVVLNDIGFVSTETMEYLRQLPNPAHEGESVIRNWRPQLPLNGRKVYNTAIDQEFGASTAEERAEICEGFNSYGPSQRAAKCAVREFCQIDLSNPEAECTAAAEVVSHACADVNSIEKYRARKSACINLAGARCQINAQNQCEDLGSP